MGIRINVYRFPLGDCTNGGVSGRHTTLTVVNCEGPFNPTPDAPPVYLHSHHRGCLRIVPAAMGPNGKWLPIHGHWMMGGNFGHTSDSRFVEKCRELLDTDYFYGAVAIHDRRE